MKKKQFTIRKKPVEPKKPERKTISVKETPYEGQTLKEFTESVPITYREQAKFTEECVENNGYDCYHEECIFYLTYERPETDKELEIRIKKYETSYKRYRKRLEDYTKWYLENEDNIKNALNKKKESALKSEARKVAKLQEELEKARQRIERIEKINGQGKGI